MGLELFARCFAARRELVGFLFYKRSESFSDGQGGVKRHVDGLTSFWNTDSRLWSDFFAFEPGQPLALGLEHFGCHVTCLF